MEVMQPPLGRGDAKRWWLPFFLLLGLVLGPALGGSAAWIHSHGESGGHMHILPDQHVHGELGALDAWHSEQHRQVPADEEPGYEDLAPTGFLIVFHDVLSTPRGTALQGLVPDLAPLAGALPIRWHLVPIDGTHRPHVCRCGWPPQGRQLSGTDALLRSSHAILI